MAQQLFYIPQGRIVVARVPGGRGDGKARWYLVVSETSENGPGRPLDCMGISTKFSDKDFRLKVPVNPDDPTTENPTNLRERCAVIGDWFVTIQREWILNENHGYLPRAEFDALMDYIDTLN